MATDVKKKARRKKTTKVTKSETKPRRKKSTKVANGGSKARLSEELVRIRAYQVYERRQADGLAGDPQSDWLEAERLLSIGEDRRP